MFMKSKAVHRLSLYSELHDCMNGGAWALNDGGDDNDDSQFASLVDNVDENTLTVDVDIKMGLKREVNLISNNSNRIH